MEGELNSSQNGVASISFRADVGMSDDCLSFQQRCCSKLASCSLTIKYSWSAMVALTSYPSACWPNFECAGRGRWQWQCCDLEMGNVTERGGFVENVARLSMRKAVDVLIDRYPAAPPHESHHPHHHSNDATDEVAAWMRQSLEERDAMMDST